MFAQPGRSRSTARPLIRRSRTTAKASPARSNDLPSGTPAFATSFGSIGALLPEDGGIFAQISVSDDPG
jgi:hypothetical protein